MALQFPDVDEDVVERIVGQLKSQGIFDHFRKDCLADVDSRPAYQNLRDKVNRAVADFLSKQPWKDDLNKNKIRESLRKHVQQGYLESGVNRIVEQVVNPKIFSVFMPKVEDVIYQVMGIEKPTNSEDRSHNRFRMLLSQMPPPTPADTLAEMLPSDLDPVSPGSINESGNESANLNDSITSKIVDESDNVSRDINKEFNLDINEASNDSKLSGISDLSSHGSTTKLDISESAHLPGDKTEMNCERSRDEKSNIIDDKSRQGGNETVSGGGFDFDNFSNLKEKLMKSDPLNKNVVDKDRIDSAVTSTPILESTNEVKDGSLKHTVLNEDSLSASGNTEESKVDKSQTKSPVSYMYSEESVGSSCSQSSKIKLEKINPLNESTRNSLLGCDDSSVSFIEKKFSEVKSQDTSLCVDSLKDESQMSLISNNSRKTSNFGIVKSGNENSLDISELSSPDISKSANDDKRKFSDKNSLTSSHRSDKHDSKHRRTDSSRERKYSRDKKSLQNKDTDKSKHGENYGDSPRKETSSSRDRYLSNNKSDSKSRYYDKRSNDDSKKDANEREWKKSSSHKDKTKSEKTSKHSSDKDKDDKRNYKKEEPRKNHGDQKSSSGKDRESKSGDDLKNPKSKDKDFKSCSDDDKHSKKEKDNRKLEKDSKNTISKEKDAKLYSNDKDRKGLSGREKELKPKGEKDNKSASSSKDDASKLKPDHTVSKSTKDNKSASDKSSKSKDNKPDLSEKDKRKSSLNVSETSSKKDSKDDKDSKKRKRDNCSDELEKREHRRSRDRDDGGSKNSGKKSDDRKDTEKKSRSSSNKHESKIHSSGKKSSKEASDDLMESNDSSDINIILQRIDSSIKEGEEAARTEEISVNEAEHEPIAVENSASVENNFKILKKPKIANNISEIRKIMNARKKLQKQIKESCNKPVNQRDDENAENDRINQSESIAAETVSSQKQNDSIDSASEPDFQGFVLTEKNSTLNKYLNFQNFLATTYGTEGLSTLSFKGIHFPATDNNLNNITYKKQQIVTPFIKECHITITDICKSSIVNKNSAVLSPITKTVVNNCVNESAVIPEDSLVLNTDVSLKTDSPNRLVARITRRQSCKSSSTKSSKASELLKSDLSKLTVEDNATVNESSSTAPCFTLQTVTEDMLDSFMKENIMNIDSNNSGIGRKRCCENKAENNCYASSESEVEDSVDQCMDISAIPVTQQELPVNKNVNEKIIDRTMLQAEEKIPLPSEKDVPILEEKRTASHSLRTSQRYNNTDLYKPRPLISNSSRRNRVPNKSESDISLGTKRSSDSIEFSENKKPR